MRLERWKERFTGSLSLRSLLFAAWIAGVLMIGGSSHPDFIAHRILQAGAISILLAALTVPSWNMPWTGKALLAIFVMLIGLGLFQLIPLPGGLRAALPGGDELSRGFALLDLPVAALPLSVDPQRTALSLFGFLIPLATFVFALLINWQRAGLLIAVLLLVITLCSVVIGMFQLMGGAQSSFYFYQVTNDTVAVGFFANANHQATFLLMVMPYLGAASYWVRRRTDEKDMQIAVVMLTIAGFAGVTGGVVLTASIAGLSLLLPCLLLSGLLAYGPLNLSRQVATYGAVVGAGLLAISAVVLTPRIVEKFEYGVELDAGISRMEIWTHSMPILGKFWLTGAGYGAFPVVYGLYEPEENITTTYVNHAHADGLEILVEAGVFGLFLMLLVLLLLLRQTLIVWRNSSRTWGVIARAASIAIWLPIVHSLVDYPMRTPTVASFAALSFALMLREKEARKKAKPEGDASKPFSKTVEI